MGVYVDNLVQVAPTGGWPWHAACHLFADSIPELHAFAQRLSMRRSWFQEGSFPHYDLTANKRAEAIRMGATALDRNEAVAKWREIRGKAR